MARQALLLDAKGDRAADTLYAPEAAGRGECARAFGDAALRRGRLRRPGHRRGGGDLEGRFAWCSWTTGGSTQRNQAEAGRATFVCEQKPKGWRIVHVHSSQLLPWDASVRGAPLIMSRILSAVLGLMSRARIEHKPDGGELQDPQASPNRHRGCRRNVERNECQGGEMARSRKCCEHGRFLRVARPLGRTGNVAAGFRRAPGGEGRRVAIVAAGAVGAACARAAALRGLEVAIFEPAPTPPPRRRRPPGCSRPKSSPVTTCWSPSRCAPAPVRAARPRLRETTGMTSVLALRNRRRRVRRAGGRPPQGGGGPAAASRPPLRLAGRR